MKHIVQHARVGFVVGSAWALWAVLIIAEQASGLTSRPVNWPDVPTEIAFMFMTGWVGGTTYSWLRTRTPKQRWQVAAAASGICGLLPLVLGGPANPRSIFRTDAFPLVLLILLPFAALFGIVIAALARYGFAAGWGARANRWAMRPNDR